MSPTHRPASCAYVFVVPWDLSHVGGVNQVVINLAAEMTKTGSFRPIFWIDDWNAPNPAWEKHGSVDVVRWRIRASTSQSSLKKQLLYVLWKRRFGPVFNRFCLDNNVVAINLHYPGANAFSLTEIIRQCAPKVKVLLSFHGTDVKTIEEATISERRQWASLILKVKAVVACSHDLGRRISSCLGNSMSLHVVHNGVNINSFVSTVPDVLHESGNVILSVGRFDKKKGQDVLIKAFSSIASIYENLRLVLIGANDTELPTLYQMCEEAGLASRVSFFTDVPHELMPAHFKRASIFVLPSRQEAFGIVLLEASCFALPVVATKVGGIPEIIENDITGLLIDVDNASNLAMALRSILDEPQKAQSMGQALQKKVAREFTWTHAHEKYKNLATM